MIIQYITIMWRSDLTKYSKIYRLSYWGQAQIISDEPSPVHTPDIIANRNQFVIDYDIKKSLNYHQQPNYLSDYIIYLLNKSNERRDLFDHVEAYRTADNRIVIITSPYNPNPPTRPEFKSTYKLYNEHAHTFVQVTTRKEIQAFNSQHSARYYRR